MTSRFRLAIVATHPVQYYAPWFRYIAESGHVDLKVFYLWDFGVTTQTDPGFGQKVCWDVPLLEGYAHEFVPNVSQSPGTDSIQGLQNPTLVSGLSSYAPDATLLMAYRYESILRLMLKIRQRSPLLFRGDSHRLVPRPKGWKERMRRWAITVGFKRFSAVLFVGTANRRYFSLHGVPDSHLHFSPHAVDNARFQAEPERVEREAAAWRLALGIPPDRKVILFAGKFETKKRPLDLLNAFNRRKHRNSCLLFVGSGHLESEMKAQASQVPDVFFAPFQNQSEMPRTYAAGDLFVLTSFGPEETWGLAVNEAMCVGRSIVVSSHVGCAGDLVRSGENGLVFPAGNLDALTSALDEALADPDRLQHWGQRSREIIAAYTYKAASAGLFRALEGVLQPGGRCFPVA